jgi:hypothetical protein
MYFQNIPHPAATPEESHKATVQARVANKVKAHRRREASPVDRAPP